MKRLLSEKGKHVVVAILSASLLLSCDAGRFFIDFTENFDDGVIDRRLGVFATASGSSKIVNEGEGSFLRVTLNAESGDEADRLYIAWDSFNNNLWINYTIDYKLRFNYMGVGALVEHFYFLYSFIGEHRLSAQFKDPGSGVRLHIPGHYEWEDQLIGYGQWHTIRVEVKEKKSGGSASDNDLYIKRDISVFIDGTEVEDTWEEGPPRQSTMIEVSGGAVSFDIDDFTISY